MTLQFSYARKYGLTDLGLLCGNQFLIFHKEFLIDIISLLNLLVSLSVLQEQSFIRGLQMSLLMDHVANLMDKMSKSTLETSNMGLLFKVIVHGFGPATVGLSRCLLQACIILSEDCNSSLARHDEVGMGMNVVLDKGIG